MGRFAFVAALLLLLTIPWASSAPPRYGKATPVGLAGGPIPKIHDLQTINRSFGPVNSTLTDNETVTLAGPGPRSYSILLNASFGNQSQEVLVLTDPLGFWARPGQYPYGADNLPPLADWSWWVTGPGGANDTANWSVDPTGSYLQRTTTWADHRFQLTGVSEPTVNVSVDAAQFDGSRATGGGFVLNAAGYPYSIPSAPGYAAMAASLHPSLVRVSLTTTGTFYGWNRTSGQPILSFAGLSSVFQLSNTSGGAILLSLPAGSWGDGNQAPNGTPLNSSVLVDFHGQTGYFFTPAAIYALVRQISNFTTGIGEPIQFWSIGNEVPLNSSKEVSAYSGVINAAIAAAQVNDPGALVGTDDMLSTTYLAQFAQDAPGVGFLSFHYYQSWGMCVNATGQYCPPIGQPNGTPLPTIFAHPAYYHGAGVYGPGAAQSAWRNLTGRTLPVLNTETNLGAYGGTGSATQSTGTDPRIPDLMGAAWLGSLMIDSSEQNVSALAYFTLTSNQNATQTITGPHGGFGFGLTNVTTNGSITCFAPFYVMQLWDQYLPQGSLGLSLQDSDGSTVRAYAVSVNGSVEVVLVNRVGLPVRVDLSVPGNFTLAQLTTLDSRSYVERHDPVNGSTVVAQSGVVRDLAPGGGPISIEGYGLVLAQFAPGNASASGANQTGNGSGSSGSGGNSSGSGGNSSGSGSGGSGTGGNSSGNGTGSGSGQGNGSAGSGNSTSGGSSSVNGTVGSGNGSGSGSNGTQPPNSNGSGAGNGGSGSPAPPGNGSGAGTTPERGVPGIPAIIVQGSAGHRAGATLGVLVAAAFVAAGGLAIRAGRKPSGIDPR